MRIVVNDSSALIDLKKGGLLEILVDLPFEFVISDALVADELLSFTKSQTTFMRKRMKVVSLSGDEMIAAAKVQTSVPSLSFHDCTALIIARRESGCILLTGDRRLRSKAEAEKVECHGVLWVIEEMAHAKLLPEKELIRVLEAWRDDITVRLPKRDVEEMIAKFRK